MKLTTYTFNNWVFRLSSTDNIIRVTCATEDGEKDRYYSVLGQIQEVNLEGEYVHVFVRSEQMGDRMYQFKFEGDHLLVGDIYDYEGKEFIDTFACYHFIEDEMILDCEEIF